MAILLVFILIFSYLSTAFASEISLVNSHSLATEITTPPASNVNLSMNTKINQKIAQPTQVLRVLDSTPFNDKESPLFDLVKYSSLGSLIFDTLVDYDFETGNIIPSLALNWVVSNDSKQWLFILREDVWFHDGSKFNGSAVKFNYDRLIDPRHPAYSSDETFDNFPLDSIDIISDYRVMFTFTTSFAPFLEAQASDIEIKSPINFQGANISTLIGTGPYQYDQIVKEEDKQTLVLIRNPSYFRGIPPFEEIHYIFYYDFEDCSEAINANLGDVAPFDPPMANVTEYWDYPFTGAGEVHLGWLNHQREILSNQKVRLALNFAVDKFQYISELNALGFRGETVFRSFFPRFVSYRNDSLPGYPYNVTKANELLDEAGYPRDNNGYRFNLEIIVSNSTRERADFLVGYFDTIGINCTILALPFVDAVKKTFFQGEFELALFKVTQLYNPSFLHWFLHSTGEFNAGNYSNHLMDQVLELSLTSPIHQEREYYNNIIQTIAQDEAPYLLLFENLNQYCRANHVSSVVKVNKNYRFGFNYSLSVTSEIFMYTDIPISSDPLYFPFTDTLITQSDGNNFNIDISMSYELEQYFQSFQGTGKFIQVSTGQKNAKYRLRCYYNSFEVEELFLDQLYSYNQNSNSWSLLDIISFNSSLRYIEVELKGGLHFLSLGRKFTFITYKLVPIISLLFGSVLVFAVVIVFYNQLQINRFKRRYNL